LVEARLFYTVAIHIFCSHAECGHTVKQQNVSVHMENVPALLYSFFFLAMYICRPHIYIIVSCFEVMDQYLHKSMDRMCGEEISCGTVTNSKHQHVLYADLIHLLFALFTCTMFVQKPSRAAAICLGYFVPSACPCFGQISLLVRHGGLCTTDCLGLMALGVITW